MKKEIKEGDIAIQVNAPVSAQFVRVLGLSGANNVQHEHLYDKAKGVVDRRFIRKCNKTEELYAKITYGL